MQMNQKVFKYLDVKVRNAEIEFETTNSLLYTLLTIASDMILEILEQNYDISEDLVIDIKKILHQMSGAALCLDGSLPFKAPNGEYTYFQEK